MITPDKEINFRRSTKKFPACPMDKPFIFLIQTLLIDIEYKEM